MKRTGIALLAAAMVLSVSVGLRADSGDPQNYSLSLGQGWNMVGLPAVPLDPSVPSVFANLKSDDPAQNIDGQLTRWDPITRSSKSYTAIRPTTFGNLLIGDGYWVLKETAGTLVNSYQGVGVSGDHWISLPKKGYTLIGYPNATPATLSFDKLMVTNGIETKTINAAIAASWVNQVAYTWNNTTRSLQSVGQTADPTARIKSMAVGKGYWFLSNIDNLALIVPQS